MARKADPPAILIRGQEADDWEDLAALRSGPQAIYYTLQIPYLSRDVVREKAENPRPSSYILVAVVEDQVVGQLGLYLGTGRRAHVAGLDMMVHDDFQGRGIGSALLDAAVDLAENWLNISRIELEVYTDNSRAIALYEKFGFQVEGVLRDHSWRAGRLVDSYVMARLREDN